MHVEASSYVADQVQTLDLRGDVLELGGRNINGGVRTLIPHDRWLSVDITPGPDVDLVADAATLNLSDRFDVVVCTEVLEHTASAPEIVATAARHLNNGGYFVATMAGPDRARHSAVDGGVLQPGEFYRNVDPAELDSWLDAADFTEWAIDVAGDDVRCWAKR